MKNIFFWGNITFIKSLLISHTTKISPNDKFTSLRGNLALHRLWTNKHIISNSWCPSHVLFICVHMARLMRTIYWLLNDNCVDLAKKNGQIHTKISLTETFPLWYMESNIPWLPLSTFGWVCCLVSLHNTKENGKTCCNECENSPRTTKMRM